MMKVLAYQFVKNPIVHDEHIFDYYKNSKEKQPISIT